MAEQPMEVPLEMDRRYLPIGLYGWRKRCLYLLVLLLVVVLLVNLGLTVWILVSLNFNMNGMGNVEITDSGIRLDGPSEFIGPIYAQNISTDRGSSLLINSQDRVEMTVAGNTRVAVTPSSVNVSASTFSVQESTTADVQPSLLSVSNDVVKVGAARLQVTGSLGLQLNGPLETSLIHSPADQNLLVQSFSGEMTIRGGNGVNIEDGDALGGGVIVTSEENIALSSQNGEVVMNAQEFIFQGIPRSGESPDGLYEVCACRNGRLFLTPSSQGCGVTSLCSGL